MDYRVVGTEVSTADRPSERLRGGILYAQGTVTVDLVRRDPRLLVWEGIYHDDEEQWFKARTEPAIGREEAAFEIPA